MISNARQRKINKKEQTKKKSKQIGATQSRMIYFFVYLISYMIMIFGINVESLWLSSWSEIGQLPNGVTKHFGAYNNIKNEIYLAGGIVSLTSATNEFQTLKLQLLDNSNFPSIIWSNTSNYYASQMDFQFSLSQFYQHHQSSGYYNNKLFIVEPFYGGDFESLYFLSCDTIKKQCSFISSLDDNLQWNYFQPCVTQKDNLLYIIGGINGAQTTNQILIFDMATETFINNTQFNSFGPLQNGQVYTGCTVCNNKLYIVGGDCNGQIATNHIQQCDNTYNTCQTLNIHLSSNLRWPRAVCLNDQVCLQYMF